MTDGTDLFDGAVARVLDDDHIAVVTQLRMVESAFGREDGLERNVGILAPASHPLVEITLLDPFDHEAIPLPRVVERPERWHVLESLVLEHPVELEHARECVRLVRELWAEREPVTIARTSEDAVARRNWDARCIVGWLLRFVVCGRTVRRLFNNSRHLRSELRAELRVVRHEVVERVQTLEQRCIDPLSEARPVPHDERRHDAADALVRRPDACKVRASEDRAFPEGEQSTSEYSGLRHDESVVGRDPRELARRTEGGDRRPHHGRVGHAHAFLAEAEPIGEARLEPVDHDVPRRDHFRNTCAAFGRREVGDNALLAPVPHEPA
jgi:hypothetical protein